MGSNKTQHLENLERQAYSCKRACESNPLGNYAGQPHRARLFTQAFDTTFDYFDKTNKEINAELRDDFYQSYRNRFCVPISAQPKPAPHCRLVAAHYPIPLYAILAAFEAHQTDRLALKSGQAARYVALREAIGAPVLAEIEMHLRHFNEPTRPCRDLMLSPDIEELIDLVAAANAVSEDMLALEQPAVPSPSAPSTPEPRAAAPQVRLSRAAQRMTQQQPALPPQSVVRAAALLQDNLAAAAVPKALRCAMSNRVMVDPVLSPHGHHFERGVIEQHLASKPICPITNKPLRAAQLRADTRLHRVLERRALDFAETPATSAAASDTLY